MGTLSGKVFKISVYKEACFFHFDHLVRLVCVREGGLISDISHCSESFKFRASECFCLGT